LVGEESYFISVPQLHKWVRSLPLCVEQGHIPQRESSSSSSSSSRKKKQQKEEAVSKQPPSKPTTLLPWNEKIKQKYHEQHQQQK
jgi:hypothetical protein